jgi:hypothetical protein
MTARLPCTHGCRHRARIVVCRQLRGLHPGSVLVILTARDDEMDVVVALDADADESWSCAPASSICWRGSPLSRMLAHSGKAYVRRMGRALGPLHQDTGRAPSGAMFRTTAT